MKFSTGRRSRLKHSTGIEMAKLGKIKRRIKAVKHSSGGESPLLHTTGQVTDAKALYDQFEAEVEKMGEEEEKLKEQENLQR